MGPLGDRDACERLSGLYFVRGATWAPLRAEAHVNAFAFFIPFGALHGPHRGPRHLRTPLAVFTSFWARHWLPLRAEALVNALAVFTSFGAQHGPLENREKSYMLGNRAVLFKSLERWAECICSMEEY